jgi:endo-1,4-beta-xylanase
MQPQSFRFITLSFFLLFYVAGYGQNTDRCPIIVEAESGTLGSEFRTQTGSEPYIRITTNFDQTSGTTSYPGENRTAVYEVTFPDTGTFDLFARVRVGPNTFDDDSFFYGNGFGDKNCATAGAWILCNGLASAGFSDANETVRDAGAEGSNTWKWVNLSRNSYQGASRNFTLNNTEDLIQNFCIGARENGLDIDKFAFGKSKFYFTVENLDCAQAGSLTNPNETVEPPPRAPLALGKCKFLGCGHETNQSYRFEEYWNQVTPGNAGKWGSAEPSRDHMSWGALDAAYRLAKDNGFPYRHHVLVWGNQQPEWIETLTSEEQLEEIEEWFASVAERYPDIDYLEVVNEPLHDPPNKDDNGGGNYIKALGGSNDLYGTGWDWVIRAFELARDTFPGTTKLMLNDYNIANSSSNTTAYLKIVALLQERDLIDCIGIQGHAFSTRCHMSMVTPNLNRLAETGLPIMVTEMDIDGGTDDPTEEDQLNEYQRIFPTFWAHPGVIGITLWGWRPGMWIADGRLINTNGSERLAMQWLSAYVDTADFETATSVQHRESLTDEFCLSDNYPNPFNSTTQMQYSVPRTSFVTIKIFNLHGQVVQELFEGIRQPGDYITAFNATGLPSGVYICRMQAGNIDKRKRLMLLK